MSFLNRESILGSEDLAREEVQVPEWGGSIYVRCMTGTERDAFECEVYANRGKELQVNTENFRARLLVRTLVDEKGDRIFADADIGALGQKSGKALDRLYSVAKRLSGLSPKDVDELTKN